MHTGGGHWAEAPVGAVDLAYVHTIVREGESYLDQGARPLSPPRRPPPGAVGIGLRAPREEFLDSPAYGDPERSIWRPAASPDGEGGAMREGAEGEETRAQRRQDNLPGSTLRQPGERAAGEVVGLRRVDEGDKTPTPVGTAAQWAEGLPTEREAGMAEGAEADIAPRLREGLTRVQQPTAARALPTVDDGVEQKEEEEDEEKDGSGSLQDERLRRQPMHLERVLVEDEVEGKEVPLRDDERLRRRDEAGWCQDQGVETGASGGGGSIAGSDGQAALATGRWTGAEDALLVAGMVKFAAGMPGRWSLISREVRTRNAKQVKRRAAEPGILARVAGAAVRPEDMRAGALGAFEPSILRKELERDDTAQSARGDRTGAPASDGLRPATIAGRNEVLNTDADLAYVHTIVREGESYVDQGLSAQEARAQEGSPVREHLRSVGDLPEGAEYGDPARAVWSHDEAGQGRVAGIQVREASEVEGGEAGGDIPEHGEQVDQAYIHTIVKKGESYVDQGAVGYAREWQRGRDELLREPGEEFFRLPAYGDAASAVWSSCRAAHSPDVLFPGSWGGSWGGSWVAGVVAGVVAGELRW